MLRWTHCGALIALAGLVFAADEPVQLIKPVVPSATSIRVRVPTSEEKPTFYHFAAQVPKARSKEGEMAKIRVALECRPGKSVVTAKKWESWGYEIPANRTGILPELVIRGVQLAPKLSRGGHDVEIRFPAIRVEIVEPPVGEESVLGCDILLAMNDLTKNADRHFEPRLWFSDQFLELTVPSGSVKRPGTGDEAPPEPAIDPDEKLVPAMGPTTIRGIAVFTYSAINGKTRYKNANGKYEPVRVTVSSTTNCPGGVIMSMGAARGCEIEFEKGKEMTGTGTNFETTMLKGTMKELRIGFQTGADRKGRQDLVLKDVLVWVDKNDSGHMVWLGPSFLRQHFKNPVYACGPDGAWKLHGRLSPEVLQDVKTRPKPP